MASKKYTDNQQRTTAERTGMPPPSADDVENAKLLLYMHQVVLNGAADELGAALAATPEPKFGGKHMVFVERTRQHLLYRSPVQVQIVIDAEANAKARAEAEAEAQTLRLRLRGTRVLKIWADGHENPAFVRVRDNDAEFAGKVLAVAERAFGSERYGRGQVRFRGRLVRPCVPPNQAGVLDGSEVRVVPLPIFARPKLMVLKLLGPAGKKSHVKLAYTQPFRLGVLKHYNRKYATECTYVTYNKKPVQNKDSMWSRAMEDGATIVVG